MDEDLTPEESAALYRHEKAAEEGWLRQAEYDPEAQAEMDREDMEGRS